MLIKKGKKKEREKTTNQLAISFANISKRIKG